MQKKPQGAKPTNAPRDTGGAVDVKAAIAEARAKIPAQLQPIFDKVVLSGMRIMFDKSSHEMTLAELDQPGPLAQRIANGIIKLMFMLWQQSNKTIPPQLMIPATLVLTLRAFEFLQLAKDPEATKEVLGQAVELAVTGVLERFKTGNEGEAAAVGQPGQPAAPAAPAGAAPAGGGGMLGSVMGGGNG